MSIKEAIFFVESFAHLQGHETKLLPIVEAARTEQADLLLALQTCEAALFGYPHRNSVIEHALQRAREVLPKHLPPPAGPAAPT